MSYAGNTVRFAIGAFVGAACLVVSERTVLLQDGVRMTSAEARVGRPLTPMSYAGVARRTTRRAVAVGAAVSAPVVVAPTGGCVQAVDAYGRIYTRCY
jgi:hypothetical protein